MFQHREQLRDEHGGEHGGECCERLQWQSGQNGMDYKILLLTLIHCTGYLMAK